MTSPKAKRKGLSEAVIRRALHTYWRFARGLTMGVRGAVLDPDDRVLLIRHTYVPGWHMPGGGVETGETVLDALARELREEANVVLTGSPRLHGIFFNHRVSRRDHVLVFVVRDYRIDTPKQPDREIAEIGFFPMDRLPGDTTAATRRRLGEILQGEPQAPLW